MNKVLYIVDSNEKKDYQYNILEDTIIYHFSINSSSNIEIHLCREDVSLYYYYSNINYDNNSFNIKVFHDKNHTHSEIFNHGVNVFNRKLDYHVEGIVPKSSGRACAPRPAVPGTHPDCRSPGGYSCSRRCRSRNPRWERDRSVRTRWRLRRGSGYSPASAERPTGRRSRHRSRRRSCEARCDRRTSLCTIFRPPSHDPSRHAFL